MQIGKITKDYKIESDSEKREIDDLVNPLDEDLGLQNEFN